MTSCEWLWLSAGLVLMLAELVAPGFVIFFFGLGAMTTGALRIAIGEAFSVPLQFAAFSVLSVLYLLFLRRYLTSVFSGDREVAKIDFKNDSVGRVGKVTEAIEPPKTGRVMIGDSEWTADAAVAISAGTEVRVVAQANLTMRVEPL